MKLGIFYPSNLPHSFVNYIVNIAAQFDQLRVDYSFFSNEEQLSLQTFDLLWHPFLSGLWIPELFWDHCREPLVVTVHGVRPFVYNEPFISQEHSDQIEQIKQRVLTRWREFEKRFAKLITVSNTAVEQIQQVYGIPSDRIEMIYHGVDHDLFQSEVDFPRKNTFLSIAEYQAVKNIDTLLKAFRQLGTSAQLRLHLPQFDKIIEDSNICLTTDNKTVIELAQLYKESKCFVFPTLHESFGLPILEAMASGCPVITSKYTGTEEVAGDAAMLIDPNNLQELTEAMDRMDKDVALREWYIEKGLQRASQFTWQESARQHLAVFESIIQHTSMNKPKDFNR